MSMVPRNKVLLASQGVTALVAVGVNLLAFWLIPAQWQASLWVSTGIEVLILLPLLGAQLGPGFGRTIDTQQRGRRLTAAGRCQVERGRQQHVLTAERSRQPRLIDGDHRASAREQREAAPICIG